MRRILPGWYGGMYTMRRILPGWVWWWYSLHTARVGMVGIHLSLPCPGIHPWVYLHLTPLYWRPLHRRMSPADSP